MQSSAVKIDAYEELEKSFLPYKKLVSVPVVENHEPLIDARDYDIHCDISLSALPPSAGDKMLLRQTVVEKLLQVQKYLKNLKPNYYVALVYAYRSPTIQKDSFEKIKQSLGLSGRNDEDALEQAHHFIAVPEVAGHPTGGAADLLIYDDQCQPLDFGTQIHALEKDSYVLSPYISEEAKNNRKLLRDIMMEAEFAPYDGEWWHFSYGDREWAAYYNKPNALYAPLSLEV